MARHLAIAHQTSESPELVAALKKLKDEDPDAEIFLVIPATPATQLRSWTEGEAVALAEDKGAKAEAALRAAGVELAEVRIGDADPYVAAIDELVDEAYDSIIVSTFRPGISRWLGLDMVNRLKRTVDTPVTHVVAAED